MLHFSSIRWRIALPYTLLILAMMAGLAYFISSEAYQQRLGSLETELRAEARLLAGSQELHSALPAGAVSLTPLAARWSHTLGRAGSHP